MNTRQVRAWSASTTYQNSIESDHLPRVLHDVCVELLDEPTKPLTVRLMAADPQDAIDQVNRMSREQTLALAVPERTSPGKDPHPAGNTPGIWTPGYEYRA